MLSLKAVGAGLLSLKAVGAGLYDTTHDFKYRGERPQNGEVTMAFGRLDDVFVAGGGRRWLVLACMTRRTISILSGRAT